MRLGHLSRVWGSRGKARMDFMLKQGQNALPGGWQQGTFGTDIQTHHFSFSSIQFPQSLILPVSASSDSKVSPHEAYIMTYFK